MRVLLWKIIKLNYIKCIVLCSETRYLKLFMNILNQKYKLAIHRIKPLFKYNLEDINSHSFVFLLQSYKYFTIYKIRYFICSLLLAVICFTQLSVLYLFIPLIIGSILYIYINLLVNCFSNRNPDLYNLLNKLAIHVIIISCLAIVLYICLHIIFQFRELVLYLKKYMLNMKTNTNQEPLSNEGPSTDNNGKSPQGENPQPENPQHTVFSEEKKKKKVHFDLPEVEYTEKDLDITDPDSIQERIDNRLAFMFDKSNKKKVESKSSQGSN